MKSKTAALTLTLAATVGCTWTRSDLRHETILGQIPTTEELVTPKRCALTIMVVTRPLKDEVLNEILWGVADEQVLPPEVRHALAANGLRVGLVAGTLPPEVQEVLNAPPPHQIDSMTVVIPNNDHTLVKPNQPAKGSTSLLINREGKVAGHSYQDALGVLRVTARHDGATGVSLRLVPEIHHGPIKHRVGADPNAGPYATQQFVFRDGQEEETLRELAATLTLESGQIAVIGCRPELRHSLGDFLLTDPEVGSDRLLQKVVLIGAARNTVSAGSGAPKAPPHLIPVDPPDLPQAAETTPKQPD